MVTQAQDRSNELLSARESMARELARMEGEHNAPAILGRLERLIDAKIAIALNQEK